MPRVLILSNPRSGSTFFQELLNNHPDIRFVGELLNDEFGRIENPLQLIQQTLSCLGQTFVGFKVFPEQIYVHNLNFGELVRSIGGTHVVVVWRESLLHSLVSRRIADETGVWYSNKKATQLRQVEINPENLKMYGEQLTSEWNRIGKEWPVDVKPIFVKYEDLLLNPHVEVKRALAEMSLSSEGISFRTYAKRQNPATIEDKVINFMDLPVELREGKLDVKKILLDMFSIAIPSPNKDPWRPPGQRARNVSASGLDK